MTAVEDVMVLEAIGNWVVARREVVVGALPQLAILLTVLESLRAAETVFDFADRGGETAYDGGYLQQLRVCASSDLY